MAKRTLSIDDVVQWIDTKCDKRFIHAVVASGYRFLYRGEEDCVRTTKHQSARIRAPPPDLLLLGTYGTPLALDYFRLLEDIMSDEPVRPSNGHLAITSVADAAAWGEPVSVWPATVAAASTGADDNSNNTSLAWFQVGGLFYPRLPDAVSEQQKRDAIRASLVVDGENCDEHGLDDVLSKPHCEVMFSAPEFLAVPAQWDTRLRSRLRSSFVI